MSLLQEKYLNKKSLIIYDGNCAFCKKCLSLIEEKNPYFFDKIAFQAIAPGDPLQEIGDFKQAVYLIEYNHPSQRTTSGAEAIFVMLQLIGISQFWINFYRSVFIFKLFADGFYRLIAGRRKIFGSVLQTSLKFQEQQLRYSIGLKLFHHFLSASFFFAFSSWIFQADSLFGEKALIDVTREINHLKKYFHIIDLPNFLFWSPTAQALKSILWIGLLSSILSFQNKFKSFFIFLTTFSYLTLIHSSSSFGHFQWDTLLIETGFLAGIFSLRLFSNSIGITLIRFLSFKIIFLSAMAKMMAHTGHWRDLTALFYHFETQPIPTSVSYLFHSLPSSILAIATVLTLAIQLICPFLLFHGKTRSQATLILITQQLLIALSGNYNFFNFLAIGLLMVSLDNSIFSRLKLDFTRELRLNYQLKLYFSLPIFIIYIAGHFAIFSNFVSPGLARPVFPNWYWMNSYGLFANMTLERKELIIEVSADRSNWELVDFPHKIDFEGDKTGWIAPHQPRIDWQLWFAALSPEKHELWFLKLLRNILLHPELLNKTVKIPAGKNYFIRVSLQKFKLRENGFWEKVDYPKEVFRELSTESFNQIP